MSCIEAVIIYHLSCAGERKENFCNKKKARKEKSEEKSEKNGNRIREKIKIHKMSCILAVIILENGENKLFYYRIKKSCCIWAVGFFFLHLKEKM